MDCEIHGANGTLPFDYSSSVGYMRADEMFLNMKGNLKYALRHIRVVVTNDLLG